MNQSPIILLEDDSDDHDFFSSAFADLKLSYPLLVFSKGKELLDYLRTANTFPFLIISDVNMPAMDGLQVKKTLFEDEELRLKSTPFIFWSTGGNKTNLKTAYEFSAQGYFLKPSDFATLKKTLAAIIAYWELAITPKDGTLPIQVAVR